MNFYEIILLFTITVVSVALVRKIHLPPLVGYLLTGVLVGQSGLNFFDGVTGLHTVAEFGVVFLLFTIGLELSLPKLIAMRHSLLKLGGMQVLLCSSIAMGLGWAAGLSLPAAFTIAGALALSSTAIGSNLLIEQDELHTPHGRFSLSILLFQDLAAVPFLIIVPALGSAAAYNGIGMALLSSLLKGIAVFLFILAMGRWFIRPLFHQVVSARSTELFMLTTLLIVLASAFLTEHFGLSMALGGFLAGAMLAETEYCHQIETDILPFRDIFLGLFFITVGMMLDPRILVSDWMWILLIVCLLIVMKVVVIGLLAHYTSDAPPRSAIKTGLVLAQGGEFGFALLTLAHEGDILEGHLHHIIIASIVVSMIIAPFLIRHNRKIAHFFFPQTKVVIPTESWSLAQVSQRLEGHVIIAGYGRVGQSLARFLEREGMPYVGLDLDSTRLAEAQAVKDPIFHGDSSEMATLELAGLAHAKLLILSYDNDALSLRTLENLRASGCTLPVLVRTRDEKNLFALQKAGATEVVPETLEASLMLASHMLMLLGQPPAKVQQQILEVQKNRYQLLRGFFVGDDTVHLEDAETSREMLYTLELVGGAWAVGKTISEIEAAGMPLNIAWFLRDGYKSACPSHDTRLRVEDILVLRGTRESHYLAEEKLLQG